MLRAIGHCLKVNTNLNDLNIDGIALRKNDKTVKLSFKKVENINNSELIDRDLIKWKNKAIFSLKLMCRQLNLL